MTSPQPSQVTTGYVTPTQITTGYANTGHVSTGNAGSAGTVYYPNQVNRVNNPYVTTRPGGQYYGK